MQATQGNREDWFPTSVWYFDWPEAAAHRQSMLDALYSMRQEDGAGITDRSTVLGWHSQDDLEKRAPFEALIAEILSNAATVGEFEKWDLANYRIYVMNSWGIINGKYAYNSMHNHPNAMLSGVYYIQAPKDCGNLEFRDPREARLMKSIPTTGHHRGTYKTIYYEPIEGRMVLFPSWLLHSVRPNLSEEERVCVSFNLDLVRR